MGSTSLHSPNPRLFEASLPRRGARISPGQPPRRGSVSVRRVGRGHGRCPGEIGPVRGAGLRQVPGMRSAGVRLRAGALRELQGRASRRLLVQGARGMSLLQREAGACDGRALGGAGAAACALPAVDAVRCASGAVGTSHFHLLVPDGIFVLFTPTLEVRHVMGAGLPGEAAEEGRSASPYGFLTPNFGRRRIRCLGRTLLPCICSKRFLVSS